MDIKSTLVVTFMGMQQKLAASPKPQQAVPLTEAAERIEKIEQAAMIVAGMLPSQDMAHAASRLAKLTSDFRWWWQRVGIAPKAAQPVEGER